MNYIFKADVIEMFYFFELQTGDNLYEEGIECNMNDPLDSYAADLAEEAKLHWLRADLMYVHLCKSTPFYTMETI